MVRVVSINKCFGVDLASSINIWIKKNESKVTVIRVDVPSTEIAFITYRVRGE